jgi:hypothetical protein
MEIAAFFILVLVVLGALAGDPIWALAVTLRRRRLDPQELRAEPAREPDVRRPAHPAHPAHAVRSAHRRTPGERRHEFVRHR